MSIVDELKQLQDLHDHGTLTDEEFAEAKARIISGGPSDQQVQIASLQREQSLANQLAELDRSWEIEREQYMMTGRYGRRYLPTTGGSVVGAIVIAVFGLFWMVMASQTGAPGIFPLFGVIFIVVGVGSALSGSGKAQQYREAESRYQSRRAELTSRRQ